MSKKSGKSGKVKTKAQKSLAKAAQGVKGTAKPLVYGPIAPASIKNRVIPASTKD